MVIVVVVVVAVVVEDLVTFALVLSPRDHF